MNKSKVPEVIPDSCDKCKYWQQTKSFFNRYGGHCSFHNTETYFGSKCLATRPNYTEQQAKTNSSNSTPKIEAPVGSSDKTISAWWLISIPVGIIVYLIVRSLFGGGGSSIQFGFICGILTLWITNFIVKVIR